MSVTFTDIFQRVLNNASEGRLDANIDLGIEDYPGRAFGRRPSGRIVPPDTMLRFRHQFQQDLPRTSEVAVPLAQVHNAFLEYARDRGDQSLGHRHKWPESKESAIAPKSAQQPPTICKFPAYNRNVWNQSWSEVDEHAKMSELTNTQWKVSVHDVNIPAAAPNECDPANDIFFGPATFEETEPTLQGHLNIIQRKIKDLETENKSLKSVRKDCFDTIEVLQERLTGLMKVMVLQEAELQAWRVWAAEWDTAYDPQLGIYEIHTENEHMHDPEMSVQSVVVAAADGSRAVEAENVGGENVKGEDVNGEIGDSECIEEHNNHT